jgi:PKD repeat protein
MSITASFTYVSIGLDVAFTDTSTSSTPIVYWYWDFADGYYSEAQNPLHTYATQGIYNVSLYVENDSEYSEVILPVTAYKVHFTFKPVDEDNYLNIQFTDESSGAVVSWDWDFGDGGVSSFQNPSHEYISEGIYTVVLVTNRGSVTKIAEIQDNSKTRTLLIGGYDPSSSKGVINRSTDAGTTWVKVYEYSSDAKITSIVSM